jgi:hypothetical protein
MDVIAPTECKIFWWESFHHLFGCDVEYTKTASSIINLNRVGIPFTPLVKHVSVNVYKNFDDTIFFDWIMGSRVSILVTDEIPKRKRIWEVENEDDNAQARRTWMLNMIPISMNMISCFLGNTQKFLFPKISNWPPLQFAIR